MRTNTNTPQSKPNHYSSATVAESTNHWSQVNSAVMGTEILVDCENGHDFGVDIIRGRLSVQILQRKKTYFEMRAYRRALFEFVKRGLDVLIALSLLILTSPIFLCIAILIKLTSAGPVFFKHKRLGRDGTLFWCFKFRTMRADAEELLRRDPKLVKEFEECFKIKGDPRITRIGSLLRKTSLDELPQLIQVLNGQMTLVGPRPIIEPELAKYAIYGDKLLSVRPGLSGLWQICGRSEVAYPERVVMDMYYIDHRCLLLDLQLMLLTPIAVLRGHGAR